MTKIGRVIGVFSGTRVSKKSPRPTVEELDLIKNYGIEGDKFAGGNLDKSIMGIGEIAYNIALDNDIELSFGGYGENILFDSNPHEFMNNIFYIGDTQIETTIECSMCAGLSKIDIRLPKLSEHCRGVYFKINKNGLIQKSMPVYIKDKN